MVLYWVRNKKGQVAAEVSDSGLSVHDQGLSWQLHKLKAEGSAPFTDGDSSRRTWTLESMLRFLQENGYDPEIHDG